MLGFCLPRAIYSRLAIAEPVSSSVKGLTPNTSRTPLGPLGFSSVGVLPPFRRSTFCRRNSPDVGFAELISLVTEADLLGHYVQRKGWMNTAAFFVE
jgi:hypothetical protein